ncbi:dihydrolipoyl dehydrogenase [Candidatus Deianiraea vastatrix]|uniref:Dihydrolipoyl dehydrogenase n=1 Tax=Candidatus Deianiraea vastatrix TaxID=2163644 RepID=A0A5B8XDL0_9RICK|nr:Dihydrolipoyl dehydrogenase [Candidatus Deianiraea vastatrix]
MEFDLVVIGAGPGGYVAAIRAAQLGLKTAIIERENLGGICLNWGCIPTKALLRSAEVFHLAKHGEDFGVNTGNVKADLEKMVARSRGVSKTLSGGIAGLMRKNKIEAINGFASLISKNEIEVKSDTETKKINAKYIILATGARARHLAGFEPDGDRIWTYREALTPKFEPKTLAVVGSGAIGSEFAYFYNTIGVKVTLLEVANRILPAEDAEVSELVKKSFEKEGMTVNTSVKINSITKERKCVNLHFELDGKVKNETFDAVIMAVGVVPNTENIGLEKAGVAKDEKNLVKVDKFLQTNIDNIYAIGDIVQGPWLAHKASHEGVIAAEKIAEKMKKFDAKHTHPIIRENIPGCTYCHPQIASIGFTEEKAREKYKTIKVGKFPLMANGKSVALGDTNGFIKIIFDEKTGEILGCHMVGPEVTEMIQGIGIAKQAELTEEDLMHTIFAHPTVSESIHEAVLSAFGKALHF